MSANEIIELVIKAVMLILVLFVIPYVKKKYDKAQLEEVNQKIKTYVDAAEQLFDSTDGLKKKEWVREKLAGFGINVDLDYINALIEQSVLILHNSLKE